MQFHWTLRALRYIRVVGTNNTANKVFHLVSLEAMFTRKEELTDNGIIGENLHARIALTKQVAVAETEMLESI